MASDARAPADPTSHAARCRALVAAARTATLCTVARDPAGYPFGSLVMVAADERGRPVLLLSRLAEHTQNLAHAPEASLLLIEPTAPGAPPLAAARVTVLGPCRPVPEAEREAARAVFLAAHEDAGELAAFADFALHRLDPVALRYVGGFGRMSWVDASAYLCR